jgi:ubiquitin carboxyl-terminal hydrolase 4/11/15
MGEEQPAPAAQANEMRDVFRVPFQAGERVYIIAMAWLKLWRKFSGFGAAADPNMYPGEIDNTVLYNGEKLRRDLVNHMDYEPISALAWSKLLKWYGGGPDVPAIMITDPRSNCCSPIMMTEKVSVRIHDKVIEVNFNENLPASEVKISACQRLGLSPGEYRLCTVEGDAIGHPVNESSIAASESIVSGSSLMLQRFVGIPRPNALPKQGQTALAAQIAKLTLGKDSVSTGTVAARFRPRICDVRTATAVDVEARSYEAPGQGPMPRSVSHTVTGTWSGPISAVAPGVCGLSNCGNTCYMNSALQCLLHARPFVNYFRDESRPWRAASGEIHAVVTMFATLFLEYWSGNYNVLAPRELIAAIGRRSSQFSGYQQQDSHEFVVFLLDALHEDLNRVKTKPVLPQIDGDGTDDAEIAERTLNNLKLRDDSVVTDIFQGLLRSKMTCPNCSRQTTVFEPFQTISLSLPIEVDKEKSFPIFVYVPYDPLKPKRQMRMQKLMCENGVEKLGKSLGIPELQVAFAEVSSKRSVKWVNGPKIPSSNDVTLWLFEIPDPAKYYIITKLDSTTNVALDTPTLVEIPGPNCTKEELCKSIDSYYGYMWDPAGRFDQWSITPAINRLREKLKKGKGNGRDSPRIQVAFKQGRGKNKDLFRRDPVYPFIAKIRVRAKLNIDHLTPAHFFNWHRLTRPVTELILPGGGLAEISLEQCLNEFTKESPLDERNKWVCPKCHRAICAKKEAKLWLTPSILTIHFKRFQQLSNGAHRKLEANVMFSDELDLTPYVAGPGGTRYKLFAVDEHVGCMNSGHYLARALCHSNNSWYRFSDSVVEACASQSLHSPNAYILFYERIEPDTNIVREEPHMQFRKVLSSASENEDAVGENREIEESAAESPGIELSEKGT